MFYSFRVFVSPLNLNVQALYGLARLSKFDRYRSRILKLGALEILVEVVKQGNSAIFPDSALLLSVICFTERNIPVNEVIFGHF